VKPDLVFFNEPTRIPQYFQRDLEACDLLLIMGTSLQVNPFAGLVARVGPLVPRVLINRDKVLIRDCRHRTRQLDFNSLRAYRDLWLGGECDEMSRHLASLLGWHNELQGLETSYGRRLSTAAQQDDALPHSRSNTSVKSVVAAQEPSPPPSTTLGLFSGSDQDGSMSASDNASGWATPTSSMRGDTACISELSDEGLQPLGFPDGVPDGGAAPVLSSAGHWTGGMLKASSNTTICTMISEVDEVGEDAEWPIMMQMYDDSTGMIASI